MDFMELMRDTTRFLREAQYLSERDHTPLVSVQRDWTGDHKKPSMCVCVCVHTQQLLALLTWWSWRSSEAAVPWEHWSQKTCQVWRSPKPPQRCCRQLPADDATFKIWLQMTDTLVNLFQTVISNELNPIFFLNKHFLHPHNQNKTNILKSHMSIKRRLRNTSLQLPKYRCQGGEIIVDRKKAGGSTIYITIFTFRQVGRHKSDKDLWANGTTMLLSCVGYLFFSSSGVARFWVKTEKLSMKMCFSICIINYTAAKVPPTWKAFLKIGCNSWDERCCLSCYHCYNSALDLSTSQPAPFPRWDNRESEAKWLGGRSLVHITSNLLRLIRSTI